MRDLGRFVALGLLAATLAACGLPAGPITPTLGRPTPPLERFYQQRLQWSPCSGGECSTLRVPLDYRHPAGTTIGVAIFRSKATSPQTRIGSLIMNPGGPGASGIDFARSAGQFFPSGLRARFDMVGFDPRGVGQSAPIRCLSDAQLDTFTQAPATPADPQQQSQLVQLAQSFAQACHQRAGAELAHVSTADAARDMDVLRAALGDPKLTFYGASYGTFLGALYAEQFPGKVRALVLDSSLDPAMTADESDAQQATSFDELLRAFLNRCAGTGSCPLGGTAAAAGQRLDQLIAQVAQQPLPGSGPRVVGTGPLLSAIASAMYTPGYGFPKLQRALGAALGGDGSQLLAMADEQNQRDQNGHYTNLIDSNLAINCIDRPHDRRVQDIAAAAASAAARAPHFGAAEAWGELVCAYWPASAQITPHQIHARGSAPILVVAARHDPATPYQWGQSLSHELGNAVLLTFDASIHGSFARGVDCVDAPVTAYLTDLSLPANGSVCSP
jgi:pimeloyl-ACP methyl ester carboxylesterase